MIRELEILEDFNIVLHSKIVLCGAGRIGTAVLHKLYSLGKPVEMICDNDSNKWGSQIEGTDIFSYERLNDIRTREHLFIIAVESTKLTEEIYQILLDKDRKNICTYFTYQYSLLFWESKKKTGLMRYCEKQRVWFEDIVRHKETLSVTEKGSIWVWQVGKVGSTAIVSTLQENGINAAHLHFLGNDRFLLNILGLTFDLFDLNKEFLEKMFAVVECSKPLKIITLVRDPVVQACSSIFQWMSTGMLNTFFAEYGLRNGIQKFIVSSIERERTWFQDEIKRFTGIDVMEYPFDAEKGYSIIEHNHIQIFVMQMEKMNHLVKEIGDFAGVSLSELSRNNVGNEKRYRWVYGELMEKMHLSEDILGRYYDNAFIRHFYSEKDIIKFKSKYLEKAI